MDFFTFLKLRKLNKSKVSMAERRLMVQMIGNSTYYFSNYFLSSLITIVQYPFFGYYLSTVALQLNFFNVKVELLDFADVLRLLNICSQKVRQKF
ncbi:unnamed protein product, partial [Mesorhabditis belari]|uniref:Uncharacterized protein n=1 Tax=Mesorhabditis belari TaxID=2138241 RepID=A0AAF3J8Q6_9BILA